MGEPIRSARMRRIEALGLTPPVSIRQQRQVTLSERMARGFKNNATRIAKRQGIPYDRAAAILAASSRRASPAAKRRNPRLKKVRGKAEK